MRILIDLVHPAELHFFRGAIEAWDRAGHAVSLLARHKDCLLPLLSSSKLAFEVAGRPHSGGLGHLAIEGAQRVVALARAGRRFQAHVLVGFTGPVVASTGRLIGTPSVVFSDTDVSRFSNALAFRLATTTLVPECYCGPLPARAIRLPIFKELAYLHPARFTPDASIRAELGLAAEERFAMVRFVSHAALHDRGLRWMSDLERAHAVAALRAQMRVFVSSETPLPPSLQADRWPLSTHRFHHALAQASVVFGESATVSSEAAVLGVPAAFVSDLGRGYTDEQEGRYGLVRRFPVSASRPAVSWALEEATDPGASSRHAAARARLLAEREDPTASILSAVERVVARTRGRRMPSSSPTG